MILLGKYQYWDHLTDNFRRNFRVLNYFSFTSYCFLPSLVSLLLLSAKIVTQGSPVLCLSALVLSVMQPFEEWWLTKVGDLTYFLIVGIRNTIEWMSNGGDLTAKKKEISFWKEGPLFGNHCTLCWRPVRTPTKALSMMESYILGKVNFARVQWWRREENFS